MINFKCAPMLKIRVGVVGVGARGSAAVRRLQTIPGLEITAVCDIRPAFADKAAKSVEEISGRRPLVFSGSDESFKRLCDSSQVDVVYNCTSWDAHAKVSLYAMNAGRHTMIDEMAECDPTQILQERIYINEEKCA